MGLMQLLMFRTYFFEKLVCPQADTGMVWAVLSPSGAARLLQVGVHSSVADQWSSSAPRLRAESMKQITMRKCESHRSCQSSTVAVEQVSSHDARGGRAHVASSDEMGFLFR